MTDKTPSNTHQELMQYSAIDKTKEQEQRIDLEKMTPKEVFEECLRWRLMTPQLSRIIFSLKGFQQFARNAEELQEKLATIVSQYQAAIEVKDLTIRDLAEAIDKLQHGEKVGEVNLDAKRRMH